MTVTVSGRGFAGFPKDSQAFFTELEANNERTWWLANKPRFDTNVAGPMRAMLDELEPELGTFRVFRMNRDVRFSNDKSPYKTAHAGMTETDGGSSPAWLRTKEAAKRVAEVWKQTAPLIDWLDTNVGPTELEPPPRRGSERRS